MAGLWCKDVWMKDSISIDKKLLGTGDDSKNHQVQKWCWNLPMHKLASVFWSEGRSACQELGDLWGHRLASALDFRNLCISENMQMVTWLQCYWAGWIYVEVEIQLWTASLIFVSWSKVERPFSLQTALPPTRCGGRVLGPVHILNSKCSFFLGRMVNEASNSMELPCSMTGACHTVVKWNHESPCLQGTVAKTTPIPGKPSPCMSSLFSLPPLDCCHSGISDKFD